MYIREKIKNTVKDLVSNFLYYDRKEDIDLPEGVIEYSIKKGTITVDDIVQIFREELERGLRGMDDKEI